MTKKTDDVLSPTFTSFSQLGVVFEEGPGTTSPPKGRGKKSNANPTFSDLVAMYGFVPTLADPPALRIAKLLDHLARVRPGTGISYPEAAVLIFGLARSADSDSRYVKAVRAELRSVGRRLETTFGRKLIRMGRTFRASLDETDAINILGPRWLRRLQSAWGTWLQSLHPTRINLDDLSPEVREELLNQIREDFWRLGRNVWMLMPNQDDRVVYRMLLREAGVPFVES